MDEVSDKGRQYLLEKFTGENLRKTGNLYTFTKKKMPHHSYFVLAAFSILGMVLIV